MIIVLSKEKTRSNSSHLARQFRTIKQSCTQDSYCTTPIPLIMPQNPSSKVLPVEALLNSTARQMIGVNHPKFPTYNGRAVPRVSLHEALPLLSEAGEGVREDRPKPSSYNRRSIPPVPLPDTSPQSLNRSQTDTTHSLTMMRLINTRTHELSEFQSDPPRYATLSYTWSYEQEEVTFSDFSEPAARRKLPRWRKVFEASRRAAEHGLDYVFIDSCCIDLSNPVEKEDASRCLWTWYKQSALCIVYLGGVITLQPESPEVSRVSLFNKNHAVHEFVLSDKFRLYNRNWEFIDVKQETLWETVTDAIFGTIHPSDDDKDTLGDNMSSATTLVASMFAFDELSSPALKDTIAFFRDDPKLFPLLQDLLKRPDISTCGLRYRLIRHLRRLATGLLGETGDDALPASALFLKQQYCLLIASAVISSVAEKTPKPIRLENESPIVFESNSDYKTQELDLGDSSEEEIDEDNAEEDPAPAPDVQFSDVAAFIRSSESYELMIRRLSDLAYPFRSESAKWILNWSPDRGQQSTSFIEMMRTKMFSVISELQYSKPDKLFIDDLTHLSPLERLQLSLEGFTGEQWSWWPMARPRPKTGPDEVLLEWTCVSTFHHNMTAGES